MRGFFTHINQMYIQVEVCCCLIRYHLIPVPLITRRILIFIYFDHVLGFKVTTYKKPYSTTIDDAPLIYSFKNTVHRKDSRGKYTWKMRRNNGCLRQGPFYFLFLPVYRQPKHTNHFSRAETGYFIRSLGIPNTKQASESIQYIFINLNSAIMRRIYHPVFLLQY